MVRTTVFPIRKVVTGGFAGLARALAKVAAAEPVIAANGMAASAPVLERNVKATLGDRTKLEALAEATMDERESLGFSPDEPLLRDGSLLRDHIESYSTARTASVGSAEPVQLYSEVGSVNVRAGTSNPPRPALKEGALASRDEIIGIFVAEIGAALR